MNLTAIIKHAAGIWAVGLPVALLLIWMGGGAFLSCLRFVLETLNSIGQG